MTDDLVAITPTVLVPKMVAEQWDEIKPNADKGDALTFISVYHRGSWRRKKSEGFIISWGAKGYGFGELTFYRKPGETVWTCDNEMMGGDFTEKALQFWLDSGAKLPKAKNRRWTKKRLDIMTAVREIVANPEDRLRLMWVYKDGEWIYG